jgi:hypothetical protein
MAFAIDQFVGEALVISFMMVRRMSAETARLQFGVTYGF